VSRFNRLARSRRWTGDFSKALEWVATAIQLRDVGLQNLNVSMDPLRKEPRF